MSVSVSRCGFDVEVNASSVAARRGARHTTTRDGTPARPSRTSPDRYLRTYASRRTTNVSQRSSWLFSPRPLRIDRRPETNDDERSVQQKEQRRGACEATTATSVDDGCDACGSSSTMTRPARPSSPSARVDRVRSEHRGRGRTRVIVDVERPPPTRARIGSVGSTPGWVCFLIRVMSVCSYASCGHWRRPWEARGSVYPYDGSISTKTARAARPCDWIRRRRSFTA